MTCQYTDESKRDAVALHWSSGPAGLADLVGPARSKRHLLRDPIFASGCVSAAGATFASVNRRASCHPRPLAEPIRAQD